MVVQACNPCTLGMTQDCELQVSLGNLMRLCLKERKRREGRREEKKPTSCTKMEINKSDYLNILTSKALKLGPYPLLVECSLC